jgi:HK97 family phage major capsid protein
MKMIHSVLLAVLAAITDPLLQVFRWAMQVCTIKQRALPRVIHFAQHQFIKQGHAKLVAGGRGMGLRLALARAVVVCVLIVTLAHFDGGLSGGLSAGLFAAAGPTLEEKKTNYAKLLREIQAASEKMKAGTLTQTEGDDLDRKATEALALEDDIKKSERIESLAEKGRQLPNGPELPGGGGGADPNKDRQKGGPNQVIGHITLGQRFIQTDEYKALRETGFAKGVHYNLLGVEGVSIVFSRGQKQVLLPVTRKMAADSEAIANILESKAVPTLGAGVLQTDRIDELVRTTEQDRLMLRDLLNVSQTDATSVEYLVLSSYTRAAAPVAQSAQKPEATLALATATAPVRTIAVWMPVTEQQLMDAPQLQNMIDGELRYDLGKVEEEQLAWGAGTGENLLGIFNTPGVVAGRTVGGDTLIDMARRAMTDILIAGGEPNGVAFHPLDWETVVLTKGTDNRYVWVVVTDNQGNPRLWGLRVVETVAMREPGTFTTNERRMLVGDFRRGATLWDRMQARVDIGWVNDQFIRNQRTIRAEQREAFGVKRPGFFKFRITQARVP